MVAGTKKSERVDLEKAAKQIARVKLSARAGDDELTLKATVTLTTMKFPAGKYQVAVGIRQVLLRLDHPSFQLENAYQATLDKETWSQSWKELRASQAGGSLKANIGATIFGKLGLTAEGQVGKERRESAEQTATMPYPIVSSMPTGWRIGTELGDPRAPDGTLPAGLEHCLNGEYLTGRNGELGDGRKDSNSDFVLCVLKVKAGGNDPRITAILSGASGSLKVAISLADPGDASQPILQSQKEMKEHEDSLRKAFVEICLQRAEAAHQGGAQTDAMLSGELYLHQDDIHSPKLPQKPPLETQPKAKGQPG